MNPTPPVYRPLNMLVAAAMVVLPTLCVTSNPSEGANSQARTAAIGDAVGLGTATSRSSHSRLAPTPPMGWNSWNALEAKIDEQKIRHIADAIVSSGMRDAGYTYLVIDDGWMAKSRDPNGNLVGDPGKFPSGMKVMGDYIHGKGLKFGITNQVLWDSGEMEKDSPAQEIDIELKEVQCLMLVFDGKEVLGNWADARVISKSEGDHR